MMTTNPFKIKKFVDSVSDRIEKIKNRVTLPFKNHNIIASGIIPYFIKDGKKYILLLRNDSSGEYEDFGGKVEKIDETIFHTAQRECKEESENILELKVDEKTEHHLTVNSTYLVFFLKVEEALCRKVVDKVHSKLFYAREINPKITNFRIRSVVKQK